MDLNSTPEKMPEHELRYVYLYRTDGTKDVQFEETGSILSTYEKQQFHSTDYFNNMIVIKGNISKDTLSSIWGIWPGSDNGTKDTAAQSYTLYSNAFTANIYSKGVSDSPFDCEHLKYLSVIQVHIAPEIFARMEYTPDEEVPLSALHPFIEELKHVLEYFLSNSELYGEGEVSCKIYYMLASGDFAVVVASNDPCASFRLSTLIRGKKVGAIGKEKEEQVCWSLFKTYTLLVLRDNMDENLDVQGSYIVRGCYSNLYWANYKQCMEGLEVLGLPVNMGDSLNGRYDFSIQLSTNEFNCYERAVSDNSSLSVNVSDKVKWLFYLTSNNYLSYINKRFLIDSHISIKMKELITGDVKAEKLLADSKINLKNRGEDTLKEMVEKRVDNMMGYCQRIDARMSTIPAYRKNMRHNLHLLRKLILQCGSINEVSDTRIYAVVLMKQIFTILNSLERSIDVFEQSENDKAILDEISRYLQESVRSVNVYAEYIRNNNLQTLQMPNYDIETSSSVEKLLIGYSEFVRVIYNSVKDPGNRSFHSLLPIVVPALEEEVVSVEVMFADGMGTDWREEKKLRTGNRQKLVVLKSPTQTELSYMSTMTFSLLHEIAHQLRFESRIDRNKAVCSIVVDRIAHLLASSLVGNFQMETGKRDFGLEVSLFLEECIRKVYFPAFWNDYNMYEFNMSLYADSPLVFFRKALKQVLEIFFSTYEPQSNLRAELIDYLHYGIQYFNYQDEEILSVIERIEDILTEFENKRKITDVEQDQEELLQTVNEYRKKIEDRIDNFPDLDRNIKHYQFRQVSKPITNRIKNLPRRFILSGKKEKEYLHAKLYEKMCQEWNKKYGKIKITRDVGEELSVLCDEWYTFGRWAGIDAVTDSNKKNLVSLVEGASREVRHSVWREMDSAIGQYREETADVFMCRIGKMSFNDYIMLMVINVRSNPQFEQKIIDRILRVMVSVWCDDKSVEKDVANCCMEAIKSAKDNLESIFCIEEKGDAFTVPGWIVPVYKDLENIYERLEKREPIYDPKNQQLRASRIVYYISDLDAVKKKYEEALDLIKQHITDGGDKMKVIENRQLRREMKKIRHYIKFAVLMQQLLKRLKEGVREFLARTEYYRDLKKGAEEYKPEKYLDPDSELAHFRFEELLPIYPKIDNKQGMREQYNSFCIESLLDMFYRQKMDNAQNPKMLEME